MPTIPFLILNFVLVASKAILSSCCIELDKNETIRPQERLFFVLFFWLVRKPINLNSDIKNRPALLIPVWWSALVTLLTKSDQRALQPPETITHYNLVYLPFPTGNSALDFFPPFFFPCIFSTLSLMWFWSVFLVIKMIYIYILWVLRDGAIWKLS